MRLKEIKPGEWYRTTRGIGHVLYVGGTHPPSVRINIVGPIPRGSILISPRDVIEPMDAPTQKEIAADGR